MENELWRIFENVNNWLEFAEKKNTLLLSFIGLQLTFVRLFVNQLNMLQVTSVLLLGLCFFISLISFFPKTRISRWVYSVAQSKGEPHENDNLLFYRHIANYSTDDYISNLEKYFDREINGYRYLEDLCDQIVVNSQITSMKYTMFKVCTGFMIIGQVLLIASFGM